MFLQILSLLSLYLWMRKSGEARQREGATGVADVYRLVGSRGLWRLRLPNATLAGLRELDMGAIIYEWGDDKEDLLHFPHLTHLVVSDVSFERVS